MYCGEIVRGSEETRAMSIDHGYALVNLVWEAIVKRRKQTVTIARWKSS